MIEQSEILRRRDMRDVFTFTIDPADAKDFDDALSFEIINQGEASNKDEVSNKGELSNLQTGEASNKDEVSNLQTDSPAVYQIGVHIADVSFYVRPGTKTDEDAYKRGTSVYLVDRVLPMLPEELCNDKCSLRPNEDKLCMSVIFTMDADARVLKYKICRTVIRSNARLNYDEAQQIITANQTNVEKPIDFWLRKGKADGESEPTETCRTMIEHVICANQTNDTQSRENRIGGGTEAHRTQHEGNTQLSEAILVLNNIASKLRAERIANGALTIEQDEMRFRLDEHGHPTEIYFEHPNEAHHLIEEFMLLANRTVAKAVGSGRPFVYRVHDLPDGEKLEVVSSFRKRFPNLQRAIDLLTIRAQAKAVYSTYNIGHYGLAFTHYTHFTSPIRRYPDLMVHRLVEKYILTGKKESLTREELEEKCEHCSACEQEAAQAERDSIKLFQAMWMSDHIGEVLPGHISGVTDFGLFVQLDESRCEGLIHVSNIGEKGEYWQYDEKNFRLVCENKNHTSPESPKSYTLGDPVTVKVVRADVNRAQIDFEFA